MPDNGPETQQGITRREAIGLGLTAAAALTFVGYSIEGLLDSAEKDSKDYTLSIEGGEIVEDEELVALLNEAVGSEKPVTADPTILKSTLHSVMRFNGVSEELAGKTTERIYIDDLEHEDGLAGLDENGFFVVLNNANFDQERTADNSNPYSGWSSLIHLMAHEGTHISAVLDTESALSEDYGPLGEAHLAGGIYGFGAVKDVFDGRFDFIHPKAFDAQLPNTIEEWTAEAGRINFVRYLGEQGLTGEYTDSVTTSRLSCRCHVFLEPSLRQAYDPAQSTGLGSEFTPDWLLEHHNRSQRGEAFLRVGQGILQQNPNTDSQDIDESTVRGLGMLGFSASVYEQGAKKPDTLKSMRSAKIDERQLVKLARLHQGFLDTIIQMY